MRRICFLVSILGAAASLAACGGIAGTTSCEGLGLMPGTPQYQRCDQARAARQAAATRGAWEAVRSIDAMGLPHP